MHTRKQRMIAWIACAAFLLVTLFSILFIVKEADHVCTSEDCPVCSCIRQAEQTLKQLGTGASGNAAAVPAVAQFVSVFVCVILIASCSTLISQKVRLND